MESYAEKFGKFFKQKGTKAAKNLFNSGREDLCFVRCLLVKTKVISARRQNQHARRVYPQSLFQHDRLLHFFKEFFEARIAAETIPIRVESQKRWGHRVGNSSQML